MKLVSSACCPAGVRKMKFAAAARVPPDVRKMKFAAAARFVTGVRAWLAVCALLLSATARAVPADGAAEPVIRKTIDAVFVVLKDKTLAGKERRSQRVAALRQIADRVFDWAEMARGSVGVQWRRLDEQQRSRFVEVFKDVLAAEYMDDIDRFQGTEKVTVDGSAAEGEEVVVRTTLVTGSRDRVPIDYRMRTRQGQWTVVDLSIEGVSLVNHFRKTFSGALANMTIEQLTDRLRHQLPQAP
jgi:phospholipid transport system substrate-binding protein